MAVIKVKLDWAVKFFVFDEGVVVAPVDEVLFTSLDLVCVFLCPLAFGAIGKRVDTFADFLAAILRLVYCLLCGHESKLLRVCPVNVTKAIEVDTASVRHRINTPKPFVRRGLHISIKM